MVFKMSHEFQTTSFDKLLPHLHKCFRVVSFQSGSYCAAYANKVVSKNYLPDSGLRKQKVTSVFKFLRALMNDWMDVCYDTILWLYRSAMLSVLCCCLHQSLHLSFMFALWQVHWETDGRGPGSCGEEESPTDTAEGEALRVYGSIPSVMHSSTAHVLLSGYNNKKLHPSEY